MRHLLGCLLLACASTVSAQVEMPEPAFNPDFDPDLMQAWPAWLVGDHVKARHHFRAAALRGHPLAQYNLAMMLLYREGGPCGPAEARALLHKAADGGVDLAIDALGQMRVGGAVQTSLKGPFPCSLASAGQRR
jgi:TPR repeat protein